jgi:CheY-like chemotaxis protein
MKVLIVDDSREARQMMRHYLDGLADETCECEDGAEALGASEAFHPDWVLMDIAMKQTDGISATRQLHAADPALKIIIVSNHDEAELREAARDAGACAYVLKENLLELQGLLQSTAAKESGKQSSRNEE